MVRREAVEMLDGAQDADQRVMRGWREELERRRSVWRSPGLRTLS